MLYLLPMKTQQEFEDTKRVIRIVNQRTNNTMTKRQSSKGQTTSTIHTKDRVTRTPLKTGGELMWSGRIRFKFISFSDSYDAICMSAAIGGGDIPANSVYEMLRLTKTRYVSQVKFNVCIYIRTLSKVYCNVFTNTPHPDSEVMK